MNLPNSLTVLRVFLIPFFIFFACQASKTASLIAASIFVIASLTDILDGYFARRRSEVTPLGKILDPIADKLLIISALILLVGEGRVPSWMAILIVGREFVVTGFRAVSASMGVIIAAEAAGKYKMFLQISGIVFLLLDFLSVSFSKLGLGLLFVSMLLAIYSALQYFMKFWKGVDWVKAK